MKIGDEDGDCGVDIVILREFVGIEYGDSIENGEGWRKGGCCRVAVVVVSRTRR
jgi:hypothetical protein